ncbi:MAG: aromatic ring-hydroxylating dioxygenase subunit alpha [Comamonadaceae bacterium]|nr:MAG: aromatic ring-hydroxylating dioxygenase subunit alpha [Comamonadaceae bacterium]
MVFGRTWLFLAHESQLSKPGSFIQSYMGEDPIIVARQRDGSIKAFLNQCRHRGMRICRSDAGINKTFTCSYHGWAYDLEGNLVNVPGEERAYRNELDKDKWGALKVPRIANHKGLIFGTWSLDVPDFDEYLGEMTFYLDAVLDRFEGGIEFVPGGSKWVIDCNWKLPSEQFASDMYHLLTAHSSVGVALFEDPVAQGQVTESAAAAPGRQFAGNGHGSGSFFFPELVDPAFGPAYNEWVAANKQAMIDRVGEDALLKVNVHNTIFPNFSWLTSNYTMRVWHPRGPGQIEVWSWSYVPKNAPEDVKDDIRRTSNFTFSPAGIFETDDGENWVEVQQLLRGWQTRRNSLNAQMGMGHEGFDVEGLPGFSNDAYSEVAARGFYRRWGNLMQGRSWPEINAIEIERMTLERKTRS